MPHLPKPVKTLVTRVEAYVQHNVAKHDAAKPANVTNGQKDFDLGGLALWAKDLRLKGDGRYQRVRVCENRVNGHEFLTTNKNSPASLLERKRMLPSEETGKRMKATLNSPRVQELVANDPTLAPHVEVLLAGLGKEGSAPQQFGIDTKRQAAIIALGLAHLGDEAPKALKDAHEAHEARRKQIDDYHTAAARERELDDLLDAVNSF